MAYGHLLNLLAVAEEELKEVPDPSKKEKIRKYMMNQTYPPNKDLSAYIGVHMSVMSLVFHVGDPISGNHWKYPKHQPVSSTCVSLSSFP